MELVEKAAYLQGLLEGLGVDESTREGKIFHAMGDLLAEMAASMKAMEQDITQAEDQLELLRGDVEELQSDVYEGRGRRRCALLRGGLPRLRRDGVCHGGGPGRRGGFLPELRLHL